MVHAMLRAVGTAVEPLEMGGADFFLRSDFAEVEAVRRHVTGGRVAGRGRLGKGLRCHQACVLRTPARDGRACPVRRRPDGSLGGPLQLWDGDDRRERRQVDVASPQPDVLILDAKSLRDALRLHAGRDRRSRGDRGVVSRLVAGRRAGLRHLPAGVDVVADVRAPGYSQAWTFAERSLGGVETLAKLYTLGASHGRWSAPSGARKCRGS
jgi:hypothetical protein